MRKKIELEKVREKIQIEDYTLKEILTFLDVFDEKKFMIVLDSEKIIVKIDKTQFPHLLGLQYAYNKITNRKEFSGIKGYHLIKEGKIDIETMKNRITNNRIHVNGKKIHWAVIKDKLEWLPFFMNTLDKGNNRIREKIDGVFVNTRTNGKYYYFKTKLNIYLIMSFKKVGKTYAIESFMASDNVVMLTSMKERKIYSFAWIENKS